MRELLIAFVLALVVGSIINGMQVKSNSPESTGSKAGPSTVAEVTDKNFDQEVLKSDMPVLVDFWAPWCGPCRAEAPIVEEVAQEYGKRIKVVKLNVDEGRETAQNYKIRSIPRLYLFKGGELVEKIVGAAPKDTLTAAINKHI